MKVRLFKDSNLENLTITHYEESKNIILNESEIIVWDYNFTIQENISLETKISFLLDGQEFKEVYTKNLTLKKIVVTGGTGRFAPYLKKIKTKEKLSFSIFLRIFFIFVIWLLINF